MEIWEIGPSPGVDLSGSATQRVLHGELTGRPTPPQPLAAGRVIALAAELAHLVPVLHDVSDGGRAVAIAEICIASGVGATVIDSATAEMFSEDPHRFIAVFEPGAVDLPGDISRRVGTMGGRVLTLGDSQSVDVDLLIETYRSAIPRRMAG